MTPLKVSQTVSYETDSHLIHTLKFGRRAFHVTMETYPPMSASYTHGFVFDFSSAGTWTSWHCKVEHLKIPHFPLTWYEINSRMNGKINTEEQHFLTEILGRWSGRDLFRTLSLVTHDIEIPYNREINLFACYFKRVANVSLTVFIRNIHSRPSLEKLSLMTLSKTRETSWRLCGFETYFITSFISLREIRDFI